MDKSITVILNCYKRHDYLEEQIEAILSQTVAPTEIWLWVNKPEESNRYNGYNAEWYNSFPVDKIVYSNHNFKYHGRFALAMLAQTEYVAFFDDDTIPGPKWFKNCLTSMQEKPGIYGGVGIRLQDQLYVHGTRWGWPQPSDQIEEVDLVGHAWFLKREDLNYFWAETPADFDNCEDMHLSFVAKRLGGVKTYCPPHPPDDKSMWSSLKPWEYGNDDKASSNGSLMPVEDFYKERDEFIMTHLMMGWRPVSYDSNSIRN